MLNLGEEMAGRIERSRHEPSLARGRLAAGVDHHFRHRQNVQPAFEGIGDIAKWSVVGVGEVGCCRTRNLEVVMWCPECMTRLDEVPSDDACPTCGGRRRNAAPSPASVSMKVTVPTPTVIVSPDHHRPWVEKWCSIVRALAAIDDAYDGSTLRGNVEVEEFVRRFFVECNDIKDWLIGDFADLPGSVSKTKINGHYFKEPSLTLCNAMANTSKHHTRKPSESEPNPMSAQIHQTSLTAGLSAKVTLASWSHSNPTKSLVDARQLAHDCVESWRDFFAAHGMAEPAC